jgi:uncharacterized membrane protein YfcA
MSEPTVGLWGLAAVAAAAVVAGAVNSVAGGGTILTFPVLVALLPAGPARLVMANATSTIGLWPGALAAAWAYRGERTARDAWAAWLLVPSVVGAVIGTMLVLRLPHRWFAVAVPWLILAAAVLFAVQPRLVGFVARRPGREAGPGGLLAACLLQLVVAVYGGYFGAGIGILMLALLGLFGLGDIHRLNAVKNLLGTVINGVSATVFAAGAAAGSNVVVWPCVAAMAVGAVVGGLAGSLVARRLPAAVVRRVVAVIGFALAAYYLWREYLT